MTIIQGFGYWANRWIWWVWTG